MRRIWIVLVVCVLIAGAGYWWYSSSGGGTRFGSFAPGTSVGGNTGKERTIPRGYKEYRNEAYHFSFFYPGEYEIKEYADSPTTVTITVQSEKEGKGFQVFVLPYGGRVVSPDRFATDIPSGIIKNSEEIELSGAPAIVFESSDIALGETREVWAVNAGYLYEITSLKLLDSWLVGILDTWQFI